MPNAKDKIRRRIEVRNFFEREEEGKLL